MKVCYNTDKDDDESTYIPLYVQLDLMHGDIPIVLIISEVQCIEIDDLNDIVKCMTSGQKSKNIGGGGNSYWGLMCENNMLRLDISVSGSGNGCDLTLKIPCHSVLNEFNKLIEVMKCVEQKEKYTVPNEFTELNDI